MLRVPGTHKEDNVAQTKKSTSKNKTAGKKSGTKTAKKSTAKAQTAKKSQTQSKSRTASSASEPIVSPQIKRDLIVLAGLAVCLLLFISCFGIAGSAGRVLGSIQKGLFGVLSYIFAPFIFLLVCFAASNGANARTIVRVIVLCVMFAAVCGIIALLVLDYTDTMTLSDYYAGGVSGTLYGAVGGALMLVLMPAFGLAGSYVILAVIVLAGLIYVTQISFVTPIEEGGKKVRDTAQQDIVRRREDHARKAEEKKQLRAENKVHGVLINTEIQDTADTGTASVPGPVPQPQPASGPAVKFRTEPEPRPETIDGEAVREDPITNGYVPYTEEETGTENVYDEAGGAASPFEDEEPVICASRYTGTLREFESMDTEEVFIEDGTDSVPADLNAEKAGPAKKQPAMDETRVVTASGKQINADRDLSALSGARPQTEVKKSSGANASSPAQESTEPRPYKKPPASLLKQPRRKAANRDAELKETAEKLKKTLGDFGVGVTITDISCGPAVTRYELTPDQGVKVSRIVSLTDDIKLSLAAADIRIEAPIPGKSAVGIEVPNRENTTVYLRELIESEEFKKYPSALAFAVGRDIGGNIIVADIARMPHLLIAGATGSGKSVCINTIVMSLIYKADPDEVKLIMIDPKVVELSVYNGIPHLLHEVVTDPKKAAGILNWAVAEMTTRYKRFADLNVRDIKGFNEKLKKEKVGDAGDPMPHIVIIVDELSDLMMVAPGDVEDAICRLAQMARAAGIHLVLATQRPSVNVITGLIKANVPSRIAFAVSSGVDSRTIIDMNGAEKLLGRGDMLFYPSGYQKPVRVQGAFVSDEEVQRVVSYISQQGAVSYRSDIDETMVRQGSSQDHEQYRDEYFADAARFILNNDRATIGSLQRAFRIGFNRAARIMDQLAEAGIVSADNGTKAREILMTKAQLETYLEENS